MGVPIIEAMTRRKFPFLFEQPDIPADKAKVVARLDIMKLDGWRALESMTIDELNELQAEAESAVFSVDEYGFVDFSNEHDKTILEARKAINDQRHRIRQRESDKQTRQIKRRNVITEAAEHIRAAANLVETAYGIEPDAKYCEGLLPRHDYKIDPSSMTDGELDYFTRHHNPSEVANPFPDYSVLELLKTPTAKKLAAEVKKHNEAFQERYEIMRTNYAAARAEQLRRRDKAAKNAEAIAASKKELKNASMDDVVADLMNRITELESGR